MKPDKQRGDSQLGRRFLEGHLLGLVQEKEVRSFVEFGLLNAFRPGASDSPWMSCTVDYGTKVLSGKEAAAVVGLAAPKYFVFRNSGQQIT